MDGVLRVTAQSTRGPTELVFTEQSLRFTEARPSGMEDVPDMLGLMLGTVLDSRKGTQGKFGSATASSDGVNRGRGPTQPEESIGSRAVEVPYTSIIRLYLARPGRLRRSKLAFDSYDQRHGKVASREFVLDSGDAAKVETLLSSLIPDRLEVH